MRGILSTAVQQVRTPGLCSASPPQSLSETHTISPSPERHVLRTTLPSAQHHCLSTSRSGDLGLSVAMDATSPTHPVASTSFSMVTSTPGCPTSSCSARPISMGTSTPSHAALPVTPHPLPACPIATIGMPTPTTGFLSTTTSTSFMATPTILPHQARLAWQPAASPGDKLNRTFTISGSDPLARLHLLPPPPQLRSVPLLPPPPRNVAASRQRNRGVVVSLARPTNTTQQPLDNVLPTTRFDLAVQPIPATQSATVKVLKSADQEGATGPGQSEQATLKQESKQRVRCWQGNGSSQPLSNVMNRPQSSSGQIKQNGELISVRFNLC